MMSRSLPLRSLSCSLLLALLGCPGDDGTAEGGADSGASSSTTAEPATGSTSEPSPTSTTEPATGSTSDPGPTSTTEPDTGDSTADSDTGPSPVGCGDLECTAEQWCDYTDNACGEGSGGSTSCEPLPEGCGDVYAPVCGCDGQVHSNDCDANAIGVDVDAEGDCEAPSGYFRCGYRFCSLEFEFCQVQYSDIGGYGHSYACVAPAQECPGGITCDCLGEELCFEYGCEETPDGGIEIGCPGG